MAQFPSVNCQYGAPMGRREFQKGLENPCRCFRVKIDRQGYDDGGAYWGIGQALYCATNDDFQQFTRANSRHDAKEYFKSKYDGIKFVN